MTLQDAIRHLAHLRNARGGKLSRQKAKRGSRTGYQEMMLESEIRVLELHTEALDVAIERLRGEGHV